MSSLTKIAQTSFSNEMQKLALKGTGAFAKALTKRRIGIYDIGFKDLFSILKEPKAVNHILKNTPGKRLSEKLVHQPEILQMFHNAKTSPPNMVTKMTRSADGLRNYWQTA